MEKDGVGILLLIGIIVAGLMLGGSYTDQKTKAERANRGDSPLYFYGATDTNYNESDDPYYTSNYRTIPEQVYDLSNQIQTYIEERNASAYVDKVKISGVHNRGEIDEYVVLRTNLKKNELVDITGWRLRSTVSGRELYISGAAYVPYKGIRNESAIIIPDDTRVIISAGRSPIGTSFQVNKCVGYLTSNKNLEPSLHTWCPDPTRNPFFYANNLNDKCEDYLSSLWTCAVPRESDFPDDINQSCKNYIKSQYKYETCVANHRIDPDFIVKEWRIYTEQPRVNWSDEREHIILIDNFGKIVDSIDFDGYMY